jgi:hypothetical protein
MNDHIAVSLIVPACDDRPQEEPDMDDPLVIALAQLVRDRWQNEQRKRARLVLLPPPDEKQAEAEPARRKSA